MAEHTTQDQEAPKHPGGRPLKYKTVEELEVAISSYFDSCDPHVEPRLVDGGVNQKGETIWLKRGVLTDQQPYTLSGLARALGVNRGTLLNYSKNEEFFSTVEAARDRCEEYAESQLFGPYSAGAKFNLSNNYSTDSSPWREKQHVDHTSAGQPMRALVEFVDSSEVAPGDISESVNNT